MSPSERKDANRPPCNVSDCDRNSSVRGLCNAHYRRWEVNGEGFDRSPIHTAYATPELAFAARTTRRGSCLVWTGYTNERGYGHIQVEGKRKRAHRYAWERANGPVPRGRVLDHTCFTPACVEVAHLRLATKSENGSNRASALSSGETGFRNVVRDGNRYRVSVKKMGEDYGFGSFATAEEAALAAERARSELFGSFAGAPLPPLHCLTA